MFDKFNDLNWGIKNKLLRWKKRNNYVSIYKKIWNIGETGDINSKSAGIVGIWNPDKSGFYLVKKILVCKCPGFWIGSEIPKLKDLKSR